MAQRGKKSLYDNIRFIAPRGTREFYRAAAKLAGDVELRVWLRETLHKEALRLHEEHGVEPDAPTVHPQPPPPLQER